MIVTVLLFSSHQAVSLVMFFLPKIIFLIVWK